MSEPIENNGKKEKVRNISVPDIIAKVIVILLIGILCASISMSLLKPSSAKKNGPMGAGFSGGFPGAGFPGGAQSKADDSVTVNIYKTSLESIESLIRLNGDISSSSQVSIYPDVAGKLVRFTKEAGDSVHKGDIIAYVDPSRPGEAYKASPVVSTIDGTIIALESSLGATVSTGTAVAMVGSLSKLEITVYLAEKYSTSIKKGLNAHVSIISVPDETFEAEVTHISPVVDKTKRTIEVKLGFKKSDPRLKPGMFGTVRLATDRRESTVVVPRSALTTYNAQQVVYIMDENGIARRRDVETGLMNDDFAQITRGVESGETVITAGSVTEGTKVKVAGSITEETRR